MQHEGDSEETFDPLDQLIPTVGLKSVLNAISRRHLQVLIRFQLQIRDLVFIVSFGHHLAHAIDVLRESVDNYWYAMPA